MREYEKFPLCTNFNLNQVVLIAQLMRASFVLLNLIPETRIKYQKQKKKHNFMLDNKKEEREKKAAPVYTSSSKRISHLHSKSSLLHQAGL